MSEFLQQITLRATISVNLSVPKLYTKKELNAWIESEVARTHFIDHLKPNSFSSLVIVRTSNTIRHVN